MEKQEYLDRLIADGAAFAAAARRGVEGTVPDWHGWTVADLLVYTGASHRHHANLVATRGQEQGGLRFDPLESVPGLLAWVEQSALFGGRSNPAALPPRTIEWFEEGVRHLVDVLAAVDPETPVRDRLETRTAAFYLRQLSLETALHRWDVQSVHGGAGPIDAALAAEGIGQVLTVLLPQRYRHRTLAPGRGEQYRFVPTDAPGSWLRFDEEPVVIRNGEGPADLTLTGISSDIFLWLWHRVLADNLSVEGDAALLARYFELVPPR